ncbi:MAG: FAD-dependent oxidoreductase [Bacteroidales bacterium]|jgi:heterodisulfide reductase subunit A|nr:FAD-dependent oxidoreductase [Bacteroidales bacterium]
MKTIAIIGAGIAGIEAAAELSKFGHKVYLIEKSNQIGGHVAQWDRLFPSQAEAKTVLNDLTEGLNNRVDILTNLNIQYVDKKDNQFEIILTDNKNLLVDAILVTTGFDTFRAQRKEEYGYGIYENVITSVDLEQMFKHHKVLCKNGAEPKRVAFVHCVGSRDEKVNNRHCSKVCCATAVKQACEIKQLYPDCEVYNLYMDLRMFDRHFEDMYHEAQSKYHVNFVRGRLSEAGENKDHQVVLKAEDTLAGKPLKLTVDLLVLMTGMEACQSQDVLNAKLGLRSDTDGFLSTHDTFTQNNVSNIEGVFLAGTCTGPKTIPETLADSRAAAAQINAYLIA